MSDEDQYVEKNVHPILEKLGESLAAVMPDDVDEFVIEWLENDCKTPQGRQPKAVPVQERKQYVQDHISPLLWQITYDCLTTRPKDVIAFIIEKAKKTSSKTKGQSLAKRSLSRTMTMEDDDDDVVDDAQFAELVHRRVERRTGVSAEKMSADEAANWTPPVYDKTQEQRDELRDLIRRSKDGKMQMLFGLVSDDTLEKVIDAVLLKQFEHGANVIEQSATGDYFYIVKSGAFDILIDQSGEGEKKVWEAGPGFSFGELALLYNAARSATIRATSPSEVWALDRTAFRMLVVQAQELKMKETLGFLNKVTLFETLSPVEISRLAEVVLEEDFEDDEAIIEQGDVDNSMFIVLRGSAVACITKDEEEIEVKQYGPGDYFGEIALLQGSPRKASVYATSNKTTCLMIDEPSFRRLLGPIRDILKRKITLYQAYDDFIDENNPTALADKKGLKKVKTMRKKKQESKVSTDLLKTKSRGEEGGAEENNDANKAPETLKEKVAQDFLRPNLVQPDPKFKIQNTIFSLFADLKAGQKHPEDKPMNVSSETARKETKAGEEGTTHPIASYVYTCNQYQLRAPTSSAIMIQKGQKSAFDPTPNQDNMFWHSMGDGVLIVGVCDGHGPFGHIVSYRTVQSIPHYLTKSQHYGKDWKAAMTEAFEKAHQDLIEFSKKEELPFDVSGTTATIMIRHEQNIHMGWVGDSNVMLGSWNRHDSRELWTSNPHVPELPDEKKRIEACGSDVREVQEGSWRIYLKGTNIPGLTMSRALGDFMLGTENRGVIQEPEYKLYQMQPADEWFIVIASDGIWEFLTSDEVIKLTAKKLRLKGVRETCKNLVDFSRKRWKHVEGEYCDDISCAIIQFNAKIDDATWNHSVSITEAPH